MDTNKNISSLPPFPQTWRGHRSSPTVRAYLLVGTVPTPYRQSIQPRPVGSWFWKLVKRPCLVGYFLLVFTGSFPSHWWGPLSHINDFSYCYD